MDKNSQVKLILDYKNSVMYWLKETHLNISTVCNFQISRRKNKKKAQQKKKHLFRCEEQKKTGEI